MLRRFRIWCSARWFVKHQQVAAINITEEHLHHMARRHHATMKKLDGLREKSSIERGPVHPSDLNSALMKARIECERLAEQADKRGDVAGADAWRITLLAIEHADDEAKRARERQTWKGEITELAQHDAARMRDVDGWKITSTWIDEAEEESEADSGE